MEEQTQPITTLSSAFPPPPPFYQSFTSENLKGISSLRSSDSHASKDYDPATSLPQRILDLPPELRYLQPPALPAEGKFRCFGDVYDLNEALPTLEEMGVQKVYSPPTSPSASPSIVESHASRAFILKRLSKSLLLNFLELVGIMATNPSLYPDKVSDLRTLFVNFHHLLNEYRPHQARESLILMMQEQLDRRREEVKGIKEIKAKVEGVLEGLDVGGLVDDKELEGEKEKSVDEGREVWELLEKEFR